MRKELSRQPRAARARCSRRTAVALGLAAGPALMAAACRPALAWGRPTRRRVGIVEADVALQLVDPTSGGVQWRRDLPDGAAGALALGRPGLAFASIAGAGDAGTDILAVPADASAATLAHVPGRAVVGRLAAQGDRLYLVRFAGPFSGDPVGVAPLALPNRWRGTATNVEAGHGAGAGLLSADGRSWYQIHVAQQPAGQTATLHMLAFSSGGPPALATLPLPTQYGYIYPLLSPDGGTLYAVDYPTRIHVVDLARRVITRSVALHQERTKASSCAATLAPRGERLYVSALEGDGGDGIDVIDTRTLQPVAHFLPGRAVYGVAAGPDGTTLYASSGQTLITLDAKTGKQRGAIEVASRSGSLALALAVSES